VNKRIKKKLMSWYNIVNYYYYLYDDNKTAMWRYKRMGGRVQLRPYEYRCIHTITPFNTTYTKGSIVQMEEEFSKCGIDWVRFVYKGTVHYLPIYLFKKNFKSDYEHRDCEMD